MPASVTAAFRIAVVAAFAASINAVTALPASAADRVSGVITTRGDSSFTIVTSWGGPLVVAIADRTSIRLDGKTTSASELIPGLRVDLKGRYDTPNLFVADQIKFNWMDQRTAAAIKAGLTPTDQQVAANVDNIQANIVLLQLYEQALIQHAQVIQQQRDQIAAYELKAVATTGTINERISNIEGYSEVGRLTVFFKNGRTEVSPEFATMLEEFAARAKAVPAYKIQVQGYASAVGARSVNEALSRRRADAVTSALAQRGGIPPTHMLVPAAMGISSQVGENRTAKGQAENRRVVVTILQDTARAAY